MSHNRVKRIVPKHTHTHTKYTKNFLHNESLLETSGDFFLLFGVIFAGHASCSLSSLGLVTSYRESPPSWPSSLLPTLAAVPDAIPVLPAGAL